MVRSLFQKENRTYYILAAFLLALLPRLLFLPFTYPMSVAGDESFLFFPAAEWAGYDWSGLKGMYRYYGYGFVFFLTPLFRLVEDPVILYRIMVFLMILCQAAAAPISYHIMRRYFGMEDGAVTMGIAAGISYLVFVRATYVYNEFPYVTVFWLTLWILLALQEQAENKKKRVILTIILMGAMVYGMTLHSRAVTMFLAIGVTAVFYLWTYRKSVLSIPVALVTGSAGLFACTKGIDYIVSIASYAGSSNEVGNTVVSFSMDFLFATTKAWTAWLYIILGQINTMVLFTGGIALFGAVLGCVLLWKAFIRKDGGFLQEHKEYVIVAMYCMSASAITILGQSFSGLPGVTAAMFEGGDMDSLRALTYLRYYGVYFAPMVMLFFVYLFRKKESLGFITPVCVTAGILQVFWFCCILPLIGETHGTSWEFSGFSLTKGWEDVIRTRTYLPAMLFFVLFLLLAVWAIRRKRYRTIVCMFSILFVYQYVFNCLYHERARGEMNYVYCKDAYEVLQEAGKLVPEEIYTENTAVPVFGGQPVISEYQFLFRDNTIWAGLPEKGEGVYLCVHPETGEELFEKGYKCGQIAEESYIYVQDPGLMEKLEELGVKF